jgi:hypothetical protein
VRTPPIISEGGGMSGAHTDSPLRGRIFERDCRIAKLERWRRILAWLVIMQAAAIAGMVHAHMGGW